MYYEKLPIWPPNRTAQIFVVFEIRRFFSEIFKKNLDVKIPKR